MNTTNPKTIEYRIGWCWTHGFSIEEAIDATGADRALVESVYAHEDTEFARWCETTYGVQADGFGYKEGL